MQETDIQDFWNTHPCGDQMIGGLAGEHRGDYDHFFTEYDALKYRLESHIPGCLDLLDAGGKQVLEIGLGQGAESEQLIRRGALWSGLDLTAESVDRVRTRLALRDLDGEVKQGSALDVPWPDGTFDMVFSHGVLHHIPDIHRAQSEINRVLRPGGELVVMLYARRSLNYQLAIRVVRRLAMLLAYPLAMLGWQPPGILAGHVANAREMGLLRYLRMGTFLSKNTDGPDNPFSRVYDLDDVVRDFPDFEVTRSHQHFMHAPPLPVHGLPGASRWGWHLWVHLRRR
jgi:SAM-dependent methyltransferase